MTPKEKREYLENVIKPKYKTIEIHDLYNSEFCKTFVADHLGTIESAGKEDIEAGCGADTFCWPFGFLYTGQTGIAAYYFGAFFIFLWFYAKIGISDADLIATKLAFVEAINADNHE